MKIFSIYILLALLSCSIMVFVDMLSGMSFAMSMHALYSVFNTTTFQESVFMFFFAALPLLTIAADAMKRRNTTGK